MEAKPCLYSLTVKTGYVLPPDTNTLGTLFGGKLMSYIDDVAAIAAAKHSRRMAVTASTDSVDFLHPVFEGDSICIEAFVTWTHNTSMEVFSKAVTENLRTGERKVCATAFMTFVAVDDNGKPVPVPPVYPETEQEEQLHRGGQERANYRLERRNRSKEMAKTFGTAYPWNREN